jgi:integrase
MRKSLSDKGVAALKPRAQRYTFPDPELRGHYVRVTPNGKKSFVAVTLDPHGKQIWATLGSAEVLSITEAREKARIAINRVRDGKPAFETPPNKPASFQSVAETWLQRHVRAKGLRSEREITRLLRVHVYPAWEDRAFLDIRRSDVTALLDEVEDDHGARQADYVLAVVSGICNWFAVRHDNYVPPVVKGMQRQSRQARARARILSDDEIRAFWKAAEASGTFGALVRLLLLTAQRLAKVASMRWQDISVDGVWAIPTQPREKGTAGELVLPDEAIKIIRSQTRFANNPYIFAGHGNGPFNSFGRCKQALDAMLPKEMPHWQLHDLRRTARSLLSRAEVRPEHAERVLGHALKGVEAVYDRHAYRNEKADALKRLSELIQGIVHPT